MEHPVQLAVGLPVPKFFIDTSKIYLTLHPMVPSDHPVLKNF